jgi:streptogramin lyase
MATETVASASASSTVAANLNGASVLAEDANGNIYVASQVGNTIWKFAPDGTQTTIGSGWNNPDGLAVNAAGDLFVSDRNTNQVIKVSPDGTQTTIGIFEGPAGLALDASGNLFVANLLDAVEFPAIADPLISADGNVGWKVIETGDIWGANGIAVAPDGTVYVANYGYQRIDLLTPDGAGGYTRTEAGTSLGNWYPSAMSVDAAGNLYVTSPAKNSIYKFSPDGTITSVLSGFQSYGIAVDGAGGSMVFTNGGYDGADYYADSVVRVTGLLTPPVPQVSNLPANAAVGGAFTPVVSSSSDGMKTVTSSTPSTCVVQPGTGVVHLVAFGTCTLVAGSSEGIDFAAATGAPQSFVVHHAVRVHWMAPHSVIYGVPLGELQLNAGANAAGTFSYDQPAGVVLAAGRHTLTATFTPTNADFAVQTVSTKINVTVASSHTTLRLSSSPVALRVENTERFTVTSMSTTGVANSGSVAVKANNATVCIAALNSSGAGSCVLKTSQLRRGHYAMTATFTGSANVKRSTSRISDLTITS